MTTPAENINLRQYLFWSGERTNTSGATTPISGELEAMRLRASRPASRTNPVRKDGTRAPGSYYRTGARQVAGSGVCIHKHVGTKAGSVVRGQVTAYDAFLGPDPETSAVELLNMARMKALAGMSESHMQFNVAAAEAKGTISTISQFAQKGARGLGDLWHQLKTAGAGQARMAGSRTPLTKKQLGQLGDIPPANWKDVPGNYLGYLYGLAPLADDIANGLDQLGSLSKTEKYLGYSARSTLKRSENVSVQVRSSHAKPPTFTCQGTLGLVGRVRYFYRFPQWWTDSSPTLTPFSEAWELTRMSFVLDWILPVGDWIGAMESAQFDPHFKEGFETSWFDLRARGPFSQNSSSVYQSDMSNGEWAYRHYSMVRTALNSEQRPTFRTQFPSFRNYLGVSHAAQSLALLTQMFRSPPNSWRT